MDIEYYQKTMQEIYEAKLIMEGLRDMVEGKINDGPSVMKNMREKYGLWVELSIYW